MVGLREVAVALSNPFGNDDVDFPIDKWVAQLRANALLVHRENRVVRKPNRDTTQSGGDDNGDGDGDLGGGGGDGNDDACDDE